MKAAAILSALVSACAAAPPPRAPPVIQLGTAAPEAPEAKAPAPERCTPKPRSPKPIRALAQVPVSPDDPLQGHFSMSEAIAGLSGGWPLVARIDTPLGSFECELWDDVAPLGVASFVGLARGLRPWKRRDSWVREPAYDGSSFHRLEPGFVIQGGDYTGTGAGDPGFVIPDEIDESVHADHRGLLYFANRGPNTNGMQFFILDGPAPHLDGHYTAFGECSPADLVSRIANVKRDGQYSVAIERVSIAFENPCRGP